MIAHASSVCSPAVLGIDISKPYFDVALLKTTAKGHVSNAKPQRFDNTPDGFKHLHAWLKTCCVRQVHACLEATVFLSTEKRVSRTLRAVD